MTSAVFVIPRSAERVRRTLELLRPVTQPPWLDAVFAKYGEPGLIAETVKSALIEPYAREQRRAMLRGDDRDEIRARSRSFWEEWEDVNRRWIPDDPTYSGSRGGVTVTTTDDFWTLTTAAAAQARLLESFIGGEAVASTILRMAIQISTVGTTPTNQTPEKFNSRSPAATSLFRTAWTTDPTLSGVPLLFQAFNAFGGLHTWVPPALDNAIYLVNGEQLSARSASGTPPISGHAVWEEL